MTPARGNHAERRARKALVRRVSKRGARVIRLAQAWADKAAAGECSRNAARRCLKSIVVYRYGREEARLINVRLPRAT